MINGTAPEIKIAGWANLTDTPQGLDVKINIFEAPAGTHGLHFHENGSCGDTGNAAGGHYNPENVKHGMIMKDGAQGAHMGDLGNIVITADGSGVLNAVVPGLTIAGGKYNVSGRAVVLHEKADDFGQPTGNAGARIGCGVIEAQPE